MPTRSEQHLFRAEFFRDRNWCRRIRDGSRTPLSWKDSIQITLTSWNTRWAYHNLRNSKAHCHTEVTPNNANTRLAALNTAGFWYLSREKVNCWHKGNDKKPQILKERRGAEFGDAEKGIQLLPSQTSFFTGHQQIFLFFFMMWSFVLRERD